MAALLEQLSSTGKKLYDISLSTPPLLPHTVSEPQTQSILLLLAVASSCTQNGCWQRRRQSKAKVLLGPVYAWASFSSSSWLINLGSLTSASISLHSFSPFSSLLSPYYYGSRTKTTASFESPKIFINKPLGEHDRVYFWWWLTFFFCPHFMILFSLFLLCQNFQLKLQ